MLKIKFLKDFRGRETGEKPYQAGDIESFPAPVALSLIQMGVAVGVEEEVVVTQPSVSEPLPPASTPSNKKRQK